MKQSELIILLFDDLTYNTSGKILRNSQNIRAYYLLTYR